MDELIESLIFIKVNTPGNSNCKTLFTKLNEIEELVNDLLIQKGIYQVSYFKYINNRLPLNT